MTMVPDTVREVEVLCRILENYPRKQDIFPMQTLTGNLAMDVVGKVVL